MAQKHADITAAFAAYERSINEKRFYDAHEDLEVLWYPRRFEENDEVRVWKGFINAAVCFELLLRGRPKPSRTAWNTFLKYRSLIGTFETPRYPLYVTMAELIEYKYSKEFVNV